MKKIKNTKIVKKGNRGITLIALVVTIIVLLLLAGISIMMLTGNNGILQRASDAKEITEMSQLKELAEMVKNSMLMDKTTNGTGNLSRNELVEGIASDNSFKGSKKSGNKVVTADEKYDVKVGSDLSITVVKHVATDGKEIILSLTEIETESRAVKLKVTATIDGIETLTADELKNELDPEEKGDTDELKDTFLIAWNRLFLPFGEAFGFDITFSSWEELEDYFLNSGTQTTSEVTPGVMFEGVKEFLSSWGFHTEDIETYQMYQWMIDMEVYKPDITLKLSNGEEKKVIDNGEFIISANGNYTIVASDEDGDYGEESIKISKCLNRSDNKEEKYTKNTVTADTEKNSKTVTDLDGKPVEVPAGFYYGTSNNVGKASTGFVITDSLDENGNSNWNEFVWIPVDKTTLKVIGADGELTDKKIAKESTGDYAGTDSNGRTNYEGILYNFSGTGSETTSSVMSSYGQNTNKNREPGLTYFDKDETNEHLEAIGFDTTSFKNALITEYNAMIGSVKTYGGFYVARYEMGVENNKPISKLGCEPFAKPGASEGGTWYDGFKLASTYETSSVKSSMIWGSQYDAMLNFALTGSDKNKVTANTNGAHGGGAYKTGLYEGSDVICNVYDIEGNWPEYTMEACDSGHRIVRQYSNSGENPSASTRWNAMGPSDYRAGTETRITLYIK